MTPTATPFAFPDAQSLPLDLQREITGRRSLNVYRMIMHSPAIAPSFLSISDALRHKTSLPGSWREVAILRVGHRYAAPYEIHHHERLARSVGLSEAAIAATAMDGDRSVLSADESLIVSLVDELIESHRLHADSRERALAVLSTNQLADLVMTVGFYQLVCNFLNTFGVPIES